MRKRTVLSTDIRTALGAEAWQAALTVEQTALTDEQTRAFEDWVGRRLADWPLDDILAFERWLLDDCRFEFIPAVRKACTTRRSLSESAS